MLKKINEFRMAVLSIMVLIGLAFTGYDTFAKETDFQEFKAEYQFDKDAARRKELREIIFDCQTKYADSDNEFIIKTCRDAEIELEEFKN